MKVSEKSMLEKKVWAVMGVTDKTHRFGYKIYKILKERGYTVYGINPNLPMLEGEKIYASIADLPETVDVLDVVVNPTLAKKALEEAKEAGIENIFFQPGSHVEETVEKAEELGLNWVCSCAYAALV